MKNVISTLLVLVFVLFCALPVCAADGKVTYNSNAGEFVFSPGSEHSLTDLFSNFKDVMPGDTLTQKITVKNDADNKVKVKIYMRSSGAHEDSAEFLSQLGLKVQKSGDNETAYMFDAVADETAQLTDWVCLGMLYSGGEVNLDVTLNVSVELDNDFQKKIGSLDWEFKIEEFPVEDSDPQAPQTGDVGNIAVWFVLVIAAVSILIILLFRKKQDKKQEQAPIR